MTQFARFAAVGASSFALNFVAYVLILDLVWDEHRFAAVASFLVGVANGFFWNRRWTFDARAGIAHRQAVRFLLTASGALVFNLAVLEILIRSGMSKTGAQAVALVAAAPLTFTVNRRWTFRP
jgi:putative flippase GtrA